MKNVGHKAVSFLFAVLIVTASFGAPIARAETTQVQQVTETNVQQTNRDSITARQKAYISLQNAKLPGKKRGDLLRSLNQTFSIYIGTNQVTSSPFTVDRKIAAQTQSHAPAVKTALLTSDAWLAQIAVTDARRVFGQLRAQDVEFDENAVRGSLSNAEKSLEKGDQLREKDTIGTFGHYERAWTAAQRALDQMDAAKKPNVTITHRADLPHNGSFTYTVKGTIEDARTHDLEDTTLLVNGEPRNLNFYPNATPGKTSHFYTNITLTEQRNNITVRTADPGTTYADNEFEYATSQRPGKARKKKKSKSERSSAKTDTNAEVQTGHDTLLLDADGLPDRYEHNTTGTDPWNTDSDSTNTSVNESNDRTIDGAEDFDDDRVANFLEFQHQLDPFDGDTDDDRLTDWFELTYEKLDPRAVDADADGTTDDAEDFDGEGFENIREQRWKTHPHTADTDSDNLTDAYEVDTAGTIPTTGDSDSNHTAANESANGILDGAEDFDNETLRTALEAELETDPFDEDTDDDRLTDAFEYSYQTISPIRADTNDDGVRDDREDPDNETLPNVLEQRYSTHPLENDTDTDNLTDAYEVNVTLTNSLEADSNSSKTGVNEADNGVVDGAEDFDDDALQTAIEAIVGTDPFDGDTDTDRLLDGFEHSYETIRPLSADSDRDGVRDDREDPDNETFWNILEQRYGTHPLAPDTDTDNLTDAYEVNTTETNPLVPDSDSNRTVPSEAANDIFDGREDFDTDELRSSLEYTAKTNPFDPDTDDDTLRDGFEYEYRRLTPLDNDSDANGVSDAREDFDEDGLTNRLEQRHGTHPLDEDTDDDGLIDSFEVNATQTNPTLLDSNSTATNATEAGNDVSDAKEDLDRDELTNLREQTLGTHPVNNDTDSDGLLDGYEMEVAEMDPLDPDSDSSRTDTNEADNDQPDGGEDFDNDTLRTAFEQHSGINAFSQDTDADGLKDAFEIAFSNLDPKVADADGNGTADAAEDFDSDGLVNVDEQTAGTLPLVNDTDKDALLDGAEVDLGTDPLAADTDADNLTDGEEHDLGTNPQAADTDADGLGDSVETEYQWFNATVADSDGNGIKDGVDDVDADGLSNQEEAAAKTELAVNDTEGDGLLDGRERDIGTDPLTTDTDGDGLTDAAEVDVKADPLDPDTDGDGTLDGDETYTTKTTDEKSGVALSVTGKGNAASNTTVEQKSAYHNGTAASAGPTVLVESDSENESAVRSTKVTIPVTKDTTQTNPKDLAVYVWNGSTKQAWHPVKTEVDAENGTASATIESGGYVTVLNRTAWEDAISVERKAPKTFNETSLECTGACEGAGDTIAIGEDAGSSTAGTKTITAVNSSETTRNETSKRFTKTESSANNSSGDVTIMCMIGPDGSCDEDEDGTRNGYDDCPSTPGDAGEGCPDSDGDGVHDGDDLCDNQDEGSNGRNGCPDSDGDGIIDKNDDCDFSDGPKSNDGCPVPDDSDRDNDGVDDGPDDCPNEWGSKPNGCKDHDKDDDGTRDENDPCPTDPYDRCDDPPEDPDSDGDGVDDDEDNCPSTSNAGQENADGDADGNACDSDDDGDGYSDNSDNCRLVPNAEQVDRDGDGKGAACDADEPDYDEASWQLDVPTGTENVYFEMEFQVDKRSEEQANLTIIGSGGETKTSLQDTDTWRQRTLNLGRFAGETVTVRLSTTGGATIRARDARVYQDSDGDTLSDYRENQRWTIPYGYGDSFTLDPKDKDSDGDSLADVEEVSLGPAPSNPASPLRVRYATSNPGEVDTDGDGLDDAAERREETNAFLTDTDYDHLTDEEELHDVGTDPLKRDTDSDDLRDNVEGEMTISTVNGYVTTYADPTRADTDNDGLRDGEEVRVSYHRLSMNSDPSRTDTDNDRLNDYQETSLLETDAMDPNMDGDQFIDGRDPNIKVENTPPTIEEFSSDNYRNYVEITIGEATTVDVEANAYYGSTDDSFWSDDMASVERLDDDRYRIEFDSHGLLNEPPDKYWINVTDSHGNERAMLLGTTNSGGAKLVKSGVASVGFAVAPTPDDVVAGGIIIGIAGLISIGNGLYQSEHVARDGDVLYESQLSGTARKFTPTNSNLPSGVVLPVGAYVVEEGIERGYGWEYLDATTSLTQNEISRVLEEGRVIQDGDIRYVIDELANGKNVVLTIIGGTLMAASIDAYAEDPCGDGKIELESQEEHYTRNKDGEPDKPVNSRSELRELIENGELVKALEYTTTGNRYYIIKVGPEQFTLLFLQAASNLGTLPKIQSWVKAVAYRVKTIYTDRLNGKQFFDSADKAEDAARRYKDDPLREVDC